MTDRQRLTDKQVVTVLRSLRRIWVDVLWIDKDDLPSDPNETLFEYAERADPGDSLFELSLTFELERLTGEKVTRKQLWAWMNPPHINEMTDEELAASEYADLVDLRETRGIRGLAEWVWKHCPQVRVEPFRIGSHESMPAGIFLALESLTKQLDPKAEHFGPSTPVFQVVPRKRLNSLANHIERITGCDSDTVGRALRLPSCTNDRLVWNCFPLALLYYVAWTFFAQLSVGNGLTVVAAVVMLLPPFAFLWLFADNGIIAWRYQKQTTFADVSRHLARSLGRPA